MTQLVLLIAANAPALVAATGDAIRAVIRSPSRGQSPCSIRDVWQAKLRPVHLEDLSHSGRSPFLGR